MLDEDLADELLATEELDFAEELLATLLEDFAELEDDAGDGTGWMAQPLQRTSSTYR